MTDPVLWPRPRSVRRVDGSCRDQTRSDTFDPSLPSQGYRLSIRPDGISVVAGGPGGAFYAEKTLAQWCLLGDDSFPCVDIEDWPDFPVRGVMLDVSRDKVPTTDTLLEIVDQLADWKINQLQLYTEHTFAYAGHESVWADASPVTGDEIRRLDRYCRDRFIDLVPNQNSFGHMERWLKHPRYAPLAEAIDGADTPWGFRWKGPFSLCPTDPKTIEFLTDLYGQLLPNFSSRLFNVGCDETFDVGQGRSKPDADRIGTTGVYLEFLAKVKRLADRHDRRMLFWGDVILHNPDRIADLPSGAVALQWGYEADHPFDRDGKAFAAAGVPFYVCPGTSSWNSLAGRTDNALANLKAAAVAGRAHGAAGYLITDWGDHGHLQYWSASLLPVAAGAAYAWCMDSNESADVIPAVTGVPARAAFDLGNVYQSIGKRTANASTIFRLLVPTPIDPHPESGLTAADLDRTDEAIDAAAAGVTGDDLPSQELRQTADLLRFALVAGRRKLGVAPDGTGSTDQLAQEHRRLWLLRNRPGGFVDSVKRINDAGWVD